MTQHNGVTTQTPSLISEAAITTADHNRAIQITLRQFRDEITGGFLYTHSRANANSNQLLEATSFLYALVELLVEKGLITIEELDARKNVVAKRVEQRFLEKDMGVNLREPKQDKCATTRQ